MNDIVHHKYDEDGNLMIWNTVRGLIIRSYDYQEFAHHVSGVVVEAHGVPVLTFQSTQPTIDAGVIANLIFQTNKEWAS